jgi:ABC-type sugar transport system substrate-binding protein
MKIISIFLSLLITIIFSLSVQANPKRIGYIVNYGTHEWYQNVIFGLQSRADELGIEFEVMDANLDVNKQTQQAEDFMTKGVDVLIMTPVNEEGVVPILKKAKAEGMPVVLEGNPAKGMTTLFAICDYDAGYKAGDEVGRILVSRGVKEARVMDVGLPLLSATVLRSLGFMEAIATHVSATKVHELDGSGMIDSSVEVASAALAKDSNINVIYGINDGSALGGLQAWRASGLSEKDLIVAGTGAEGLAFLNELTKEGTPYLVEAAMFPEGVGYTGMNLAVDLFNGVDVPKHKVTPTLALTVNNYASYYDFDKAAQKRAINFANVAGIPTEDKCTKYAEDL